MSALRSPFHPLLILAFSAPSVGAQVSLTGAGGSFLDPVADRWFATFTAQTQIPVQYDSRGQGIGVRSLLSGHVDFSLSDRPWSRSLLAGLERKAQQFPVALGATVITYNLPTLGRRPVQLDGAVLADLFLGRIQRWNDPRIARLNPSLRLPAVAVRPVYRSDGTALTQILTNYLSQASPIWRDRVGAAMSVPWPIGTGGRANEGVVWQVSHEVGSVGYVDLSFALAHGLPVAALRNRAGHFAAPSLQTLQAALPDPLRYPTPDFGDPPLDDGNPDGYPCASVAWIVIRPAVDDSVRASALGAFARWLADGMSRQRVESLLYPASATRVVGLPDRRPPVRTPQVVAR